jgi:nucleoside-diphosphate kinase
MNDHTDMTLAIIKPDAVRQCSAGEIITLIEKASLSIIAIKKLHLSADEAGMFYHVHKGTSFFNELVSFMSSAPCLVMVLKGEDVINRWRTMMGPTDPINAPDGTIRKLFGTSVRHNAVHGSDSPQTAAQEIGFFFSGLELTGRPCTEGKGKL